MRKVTIPAYDRNSVTTTDDVCPKFGDVHNDVWKLQLQKDIDCILKFLRDWSDYSANTNKNEYVYTQP